MAIIKSFSVGNGDMFYIYHNSDNFTIIDCCINYDNHLDELIGKSKCKTVHRFISTHPDDDHIRGLKKLNNQLGEDGILNFYCVENNAIKFKKSDDFKEYCILRDNESKYFYLEKDCSRLWMNKSNDERGSSGINILWPKVSNEYFKNELKKVENGESPNNISPIIKYSLEDGVRVIWMGDLENNFMENIKEDLNLDSADILFAPHHGRKTGKVPKELLNDISPKLIIVGEAPAEDLEYYSDYNAITQNSSGDILFDCLNNKIDIYVSNQNYSVDFLKDNGNRNYVDEYNYLYYLGTLEI